MMPTAAVAVAVLVGLVCVGSILVSRALVRSEEASVRQGARGALASVRAELATEMHRLVAALGVLSGLPNDSPVAWRDAAEAVLGGFPGLRAIELVDPAYETRERVRPSSEPDDWVPSLNDEQRAQLASAAREGQAVVTDTFHLAEGRLAARVVLPRPIAPGGFVTAVLSLEEFVSAALHNDVPSYAIGVAAPGGTIYRRSGDLPAVPVGGFEEGSLPLPGGMAWTVTVAPLPGLHASMRTTLPEIVLASGILLGALLGATLVLAGTLSDRARGLAAEVAHRRGLERELRGMAERLERDVEERTKELRGANATLSIENALRQSAQAQLARSNEDLSQFAAFLSHELRQPLATMSIWADLLEASGQLGEKGLGYVAKLRATIRRMVRLIEGELALSRAVVEEAPREPVDLEHLLRDLMVDFAPTLERAGGSVEIGSLPVIAADPGQLRQVFRNLIDNALKYRRPDVAPVVRIDGEATNGAGGGQAEYRIRVQDNGRGFAAKDATHIFGMFRRAADERVEGAGIGLAVCRRIIERHGGSISAEGRVGDGATFTIVLPADGRRSGRGEVDAASGARRGS